MEFHMDFHKIWVLPDLGAGQLADNPGLGVGNGHGLGVDQ
jgi:hypothetical protein